MTPLKIFIFTWNTQTVRYATGSDDDDEDNFPDANFVSDLVDKIGDENDLLVIGLQEDSIRDSPLLSNPNSLIPTFVANNYELLRIVSLSGWGVTTFKALKDEWDYRPRGLRLAIFKRRDLAIDIFGVNSTEIICPGLRNWLTAGKGGVLISLETNFGNISFLNMHLPFSSRSIIQDVEKIGIRHRAVMWQAYCLKTLYERALDICKSNVMFVLGDLNFRVQLRTECASTIAKRLFSESEFVRELIKEADELQLLFDYSQCIDKSVHAPVPIFKEGLNNTGPVFFPTCKLKHGRNPDAGCRTSDYRLGNEDKRAPSWCDRILFKEIDDRVQVSCTMYDRWDCGNMKYSDHAAVIGTFDLVFGRL